MPEETRFLFPILLSDYLIFPFLWRTHQTLKSLFSLFCLLFSLNLTDPFHYKNTTNKTLWFVIINNSTHVSRNSSAWWLYRYFTSIMANQFMFVLMFIHCWINVTRRGRITVELCLDFDGWINVDFEILFHKL